MRSRLGEKMMDLKEKLHRLYEAIDKKFEEQFSFRVKETTFTRIAVYLHVPKDSSSLAVARILFGLAMLLDIPDERGGADMARRWGSPHTCRFPLLPFLQPLPMPYMAAVYAALWTGALGIMLGYKYRCSALTFTTCYWYLFLIEKSFWNNHSYLFGLVGSLLLVTEANCYWSIDSYLDPNKRKETVPYWNYFVLKYQFFILYFMAGMKKGTAEWLTGYSVQKLSEHWVFEPFKWFLTDSQTDYLVVHWFVFVFDLTVAAWMMWGKTRHVAMFFCAAFHLMNSRLFRIGMFPWVCLATMPLYYPFDWPKTTITFLCNKYDKLKTDINNRLNALKCTHKCECNDIKIYEDDGYEYKTDEESSTYEYKVVKRCRKADDVTKKAFDKKQEDEILDKDYINKPNVGQDGNIKGEDIKAKTDIIKKSESVSDVDRHKKLTTALIMIYVFTQAFLPYSHFITKGYNNWTNGLYGYSWDMMVHTWDTHTVVIKIVDNENHQEYYIDPAMYTLNDRWSKHGDMVYQYAHCLKKNLLKEREKHPEPGISTNFSIYIDVWCSMNGRFTQRLFDSKVDLLRTSWSPFEKIPFLMPLLDEALHWRSTLEEITRNVHSLNKNSDVIFLADFPNYDQEKFIPAELSNVTLTILEGLVAYEPEVTELSLGQSYMLTSGNRIALESAMFHKVLNIGPTPAYYMYTFRNETETKTNIEKPKLPVLKELYARLANMLTFAGLVGNSMWQIVFGCDDQCNT